MKVLFGYINTTGSLDMPVGIAYLSAMLKKHGHQRGLIDLTWTHTPNIPDTDYDLLAISSTTLEYRDALQLASLWKAKTGKPVLFGGCKPTVEPLETLSNPLVDAICIGEGEYAMLEFVDQYEATGDIPKDVQNIWVQTEREIIRNPLRPLVEDLGELPFPDRSIFDVRHIELKYPGTTVLTSRGCPFSCSMCINHYLQKLYAGLGTYTRFRSIDNIFQEITEFRERYHVQRIFFIDDTFTINRKRLKEFCQRYPEEIGIPFLIMGRCNTVTKELIQQLSEAGCVYIGYGIESGNSYLRNNVLNRNMTDEQIIQAFNWTRSHGIKTASYNMIGIPHENRNKIFETIELNRKVRPDIVQTTLLYPFPKTAIYELAKREGLLNESNDLRDYYTKTIIRVDGLEGNKLFALEVTVPLYVRFPKYLWPFIRILEWLISKHPAFRIVVKVLRKYVLNRSFRRDMM